MRGGTSRPYVPTWSNLGLSPRARGNQRSPQHDDARRGSIPACAGEPCLRPPMRLSKRVYPRVRGGTGERKRSPVPHNGLSPRARGNHLPIGRNEIRKRSIPACAGEPRPAIIRPSRRKVYPRVRGGTTAPRSSCRSVKGLSPRARGNLGEGVGFLAALRSIPACAGEPTMPGWRLN